MKKVIVTGGAGFVGSHLCERLLSLGYFVTCLDNLQTSSSDNIKKLLNNENFLFINTDVTSPYNFECDEIYNLACPASPIQYQKKPLHTTMTSVLGMYNAIECAKVNHARILQASTSEVYGNPLEHPQVETYWGNVNPIGIRSCYDEGKRCAETLLCDAHRLNLVEGRIVRIFNTYGDKMSMTDGRVVSNFIVNALQNKDIEVYGDGQQTRSLMFVDDLVDGLIKVMENNEIDCTPINLGTQDEITIRDFALKIIEMTNSKSNIVFKELPADDPIKRRPNTEKALTLIKWRPTTTLDDGLKKTIDFFKEKICFSEN